MSLLDGDAGPAPSRIPRYVALGGVALVLVSATVFLALRFHTEKATVRLFLSQLASGDFQSAYRIWKPGPSYAFDDFMRDWGPNGEYGPVKGYDLREAHQPRNASGVVVTIAVSPYSPIPGPGDPKSRDTKEVRLWVQSSDQSLSYAPSEFQFRR